MEMSTLPIEHSILHLFVEKNCNCSIDILEGLHFVTAMTQSALSSTVLVQHTLPAHGGDQHRTCRATSHDQDTDTQLAPELDP